MVFALHGIQSILIFIYTVFTLHGLSSTLHSIYTIYHLHWFWIYNFDFNLNNVFQSTTLISISIVFLDLRQNDGWCVHGWHVHGQRMRQAGGGRRLTYLAGLDRNLTGGAVCAHRASHQNGLISAIHQKSQVSGVMESNSFNFKKFDQVALGRVMDSHSCS